MEDNKNKLIEFLKVGNHFKTNEELFEFLEKFQYEDGEILQFYLYSFLSELGCGREIALNEGDFAMDLVYGIMEECYDQLIFNDENTYEEIEALDNHYEKMVIDQLVGMFKL